VLVDTDHRAALVVYLGDRIRGANNATLQLRTVTVKHLRVRLPLIAAVHVDDQRHQFTTPVSADLDILLDGIHVPILTARRM
jgi:hypothetical protein